MKNTKLIKNNTEDLLWDSIDALMNELDEVALAGVKGGVKSQDIADYIHAETRTIENRLRIGIPRDFESIYKDFIDEVIANGRYDEYISFLRFRRECEGA